jgi:hypothetical protein
MYISLRPHITFSRGRNKLNLLLFEEDWQSAIAEIECHPHEAKIWSSKPGFFDGDHESNVLPIHVACSVHAPLDVIKAIVEAYPECVQCIESAFKRLPLHVACQFAARSDVIEYLVEQYVASTMEADVLGRLPIHYACSNGAPLDVVKVLLRVNKAATCYADFNGWVPLHVAVHFGAQTAVVEEILNVSPSNVVNMKTKRGSNALCLAKKISSKNKEEVLALLENANELAGTPDLLGLGPVTSEATSNAKKQYVPFAA